MRPSTLALVVGTVACIAARPAAATDGIRQRSLVVWSDVACMTVVERDVDPTVALPYGISFEDTDHTADEVETGRRHQMIGLCRQYSPQSPLPVWLSQADLDDAASVGLLDPDDPDPPEVLDELSQWADCVVRIVADADRRPITQAAAAEGVVWDTTGIARGGWIVEGYTWDPPFNQWAPRPGVVAVFDDAGAADNPPVAAISTGELSIYAEDTATIEGCVVAAQGSTMTASWALTVPGDEQQWETFAVDEPVEGSAFGLAFTPPEATVGGFANIRVAVTDPMDQTYTAYMRAPVAVLPGGGGCNDSGGGFLGDPGCDPDTTAGTTADTATAGTTGGGTSTTDTTAPAADPPPGESCACTAAPAGWWGLPLLLLAARRRVRVSRSRWARSR